MFCKVEFLLMILKLFINFYLDMCIDIIFFLNSCFDILKNNFEKRKLYVENNIFLIVFFELIL